MDAHIRKVYVPMTETGFYILLCLREEMHGYSIVQKVETMTGGSVRLSPGTMYGSLSKMEKDGLICFVREEDKRKIYHITPLGTEVQELEMKRIERLYRNMKEAQKRALQRPYSNGLISHSMKKSRNTCRKCTGTVGGL